MTSPPIITGPRRSRKWEPVVLFCPGEGQEGDSAGKEETLQSFLICGQPEYLVRQGLFLADRDSHPGDFLRGDRALCSMPHRLGLGCKLHALRRPFHDGGRLYPPPQGRCRIDVFYKNFSPRTQAWIDVCLYPIFFFPALIILLYAGIVHVAYSWSIAEKTGVTMWRVPIYPFKTILPVATFLLLLQGQRVYTDHSGGKGEKIAWILNM